MNNAYDGDIRLESHLNTDHHSLHRSGDRTDTRRRLLFCNGKKTQSREAPALQYNGNGCGKS